MKAVAVAAFVLLAALSTCNIASGKRIPILEPINYLPQPSGSSQAYSIVMESATRFAGTSATKVDN